jgi:hypothetical protein
MINVFNLKNLINVEKISVIFAQEHHEISGMADNCFQ